MWARLKSALREPIASVASHKDFLAGLQSAATISALIAGGIWTFSLTSQYRETKPKLAIEQKVSSWRLQDRSTLIRVDSKLTNIGKVRIVGVNGLMIVSRLLPEDLELAAQIKAGNLYFPCKKKDGAPIRHCVPEQGLNLPPSSSHPFPISESKETLEPGESLPYWRYLRLDADVKTIEVYTQINKPGTTEDWNFGSVYDLTQDENTPKAETRKTPALPENSK